MHARKSPAPLTARVLILEDEADMARLIGYNLKKGGHQIHICADAAEALEWLRSNTADLAVVDVLMPAMSGVEFCRAIRGIEETRDLPVIMLTALGETTDRLKGLEAGADDYLTKPFHPRELQLRVEALLRRTTKDSSAELQVGPLNLESHTMRASVAGEPLLLTRTEFRLLWVMAERQGQILSREDLLMQVWGYERFFDTRTVDTHLRRLRTKLGANSDWLSTVRGEGYLFRQVAERRLPVD